MRTPLAVLATLLLASAAMAQSAEFGRASGGTIDAIAKAPRQTSGSLSLSRGTGGTGYEGTFGGEVLKDHLWFFGAASVLPQVRFTQPVDWKTAATSFRATPAQQPDFSKFLTLRTTAVLSDQTTLGVTFSRSDVH